MARTLPQAIPVVVPLLLKLSGHVPRGQNCVIRRVQVVVVKPLRALKRKIQLLKVVDQMETIL